MGEYVIQPGDTLSKIAKMTGTSVEQLQKLNGIKNANLIFAGKTIQIPDIESDQAFKLKGLSVERETQGLIHRHKRVTVKGHFLENGKLVNKTIKFKLF